MITTLEDMENNKDDFLFFQLVTIKALIPGKHAHPSHCACAPFVLPFVLNSYNTCLFSLRRNKRNKQTKKYTTPCKATTVIHHASSLKGLIGRKV